MLIKTNFTMDVLEKGYDGYRDTDTKTSWENPYFDMITLRQVLRDLNVGHMAFNSRDNYFIYRLEGEEEFEVIKGKEILVDGRIRVLYQMCGFCFKEIKVDLKNLYKELGELNNCSNNLKEKLIANMDTINKNASIEDFRVLACEILEDIKEIINSIDQKEEYTYNDIELSYYDKKEG